MIVAVLGSPGAGKTTYLRKHLYPKLRKEGRQFFIQPANPDGEGQWTVESGDRHSRPKRAFTQRFVDWVIDSAPNLEEQFGLVYLDCGGRESEENRRILQVCDEAVIVGRSEEELDVWEQFVTETKSMPLAFILSDVAGAGTGAFETVRRESRNA